MEVGEGIAVAITLVLVWTLVEVLRATIWRSLKIILFMRQRGYRGSLVSLLHLDNDREVKQIHAKAQEAAGKQRLGIINHDYHHLTYPVENEWKNRYGEKYLFSLYHGAVAIFISDPETARQVLKNQTGDIRKTRSNVADEVVGRGGLPLMVDHEEWFRQRTTVRPFFYAGQVMENASIMVTCTKAWLETLRQSVMKEGGSVEVDLNDQLDIVTRNIISRIAFGTEHWMGNDGFQSLERLQYLVIKRGRLPHPLFRYTRRKLSKEIRKIHKHVTLTLQQIIDIRRNTVRSEGRASFGDDLLGIILNGAESQDYHSQKSQSGGQKLPKWTNEQLIDQCRSFYFAGQDTLRSGISWVLLMLAHYTEWQERIREEVINVDLTARDFSSGCSQLIDRMKALDMFILETMRMYPPVPRMSREIQRNGGTILGEPMAKNLEIYVDVIKIHRQPETWGEDAEEFKPERFAKGIAAACKHPSGFIPFGFGPRTCVAQIHALKEMKLITSMFLQQFKFRLSPSYNHIPTLVLTLKPRQGVPLILESLD